MKSFPVQRAGQLSPVPAQTPWLIEALWTDQAVGILGGEPKCCKSFLALDIAVAVASGTPCLRRYEVRRTGPVLLFPAEDSLAIVRQRLDGIAAAAHLALESLPLHVITAPSLRLDLPADRERLVHTLEAIEPVLLILDPLIRLHQVDENDASQIAPLLGFLRQLQRQFHVAVLLVHHAKKDGGSLRPGQALRGSSELHGWGDSNLYLRRRREQLTLTVEHRAAASLDPIPVQLTHAGAALALAMVDPSPPLATEASDAILPEKRLLQELAQADRALSVQSLRKLCGLRTATVCAALQQLSAQGSIQRERGGYRVIRLSDSNSPRTAPPLSAATNADSVEGVSQLRLLIGPTGNGNGKHACATRSDSTARP